MVASKLRTFYDFYILLNSLISAIRYGFRCQSRKTLSSLRVSFVQLTNNASSYCENDMALFLASNLSAVSISTLDANLCHFVG